MKQATKRRKKATNRESLHCELDKVMPRIARFEYFIKIESFSTGINGILKHHNKTNVKENNETREEKKTFQNG